MILKFEIGEQGIGVLIYEKESLYLAVEYDKSALAYFVRCALKVREIVDYLKNLFLPRLKINKIQVSVNLSNYTVQEEWLRVFNL